ncbi:unnamed protein product [Calicophoron daubneyi]|uniref:Eukaryotic translation initiation factor 4E n=1 Tax=Calicophoron daubneyi TaxID=300641 RepID=A0AAV2TT78_CALDB
MATAVEEAGTDKRDEGPACDLHPLQDSWTYYLFIFKSTSAWEESIKRVATFSTIEHFWSVMLHTEPPSRIANGTDVYMFRSEIMPKWEDPKNENGGRWLMNLPPGSRIDTYWEELLMLLVGCDWETDEEAEQICGAAFQPRARGHKMSVWLADSKAESSIMKIGKRIKERLQFPERMYFQTVEEQKSQGRGKDITSGSYQV